MVSPGYNELHPGQLFGDQSEGLDHELQALVGAPFAERQDTVRGISAPGEIWELGPAGKNSVGAQVDVVPSISVIQDLAIPRHKHRDGIRKQKHSCSHRAGRAI